MAAEETGNSLPDTFFNIDLVSHNIGSRECDRCVQVGNERYPKRCKCGGLIHAEPSDYWLVETCDRCGWKYEEDRGLLASG